MTTYAKYYKQPYPVGNCFNLHEQKLIESAQCGIGDEATLVLAIAKADANDLIVLAPCTITLTSQLSITKPLRFKGSCASGVKGTIITASAAITGSMINVDMSVANGASACELSFEDISFQHITASQDVFDINNTNMLAALSVKFRNCNINVLASTSAWALDVAHAAAGYPILLDVAGRYQNTCDAINMTIAIATDRITCEGIVMQKQGKSFALTTSAGAVAAQIKLINCQVPATAGSSGGHASQLLISVRTITLTGTTFAAADTNAYTGSHTETII
jgi:hypothetical protein